MLQVGFKCDTCVASVLQVLQVCYKWVTSVLQVLQVCYKCYKCVTSGLQVLQVCSRHKSCKVLQVSCHPPSQVATLPPEEVALPTLDAATVQLCHLEKGKLRKEPGGT